MARASTVTLLPLDTFAKIVGIHPLHFNQVYLEDLAPASPTCSTPVLQYGWQEADRVGREELAQAIADAEADIAQQLGYKLLPTWEADERIRLPRPNQAELYYSLMLDVRRSGQGMRTNWGYVRSGGIEAKTLIDAAAAVAYSDADTDAYDETATVVVATTVTNPEEIAIYYPGHDGDDEWQIKPITVTIAGGNATIVCRREQLVLETLLEGLTTEGVDGSVDGNFLSTVDVYRHWNDPSQQVQFLWESIPNLCSCGSDTCATCAFSTQWGCMHVRDPRLGIVVPAAADWNATTEAYDAVALVECRAPDHARLWYRAGWLNAKLARPYLTMDPQWARAVAYLALSKLDRPLCACNSLEAYGKHWSEDLALRVGTQSGSQSWQLSRRQLDNPLGTTRAAVYVWNLISKYCVGGSASANS